MKPVSGKRLCKVLEGKGWALERINGSHHAYAHPDRDYFIVIPVHSNRDLKHGTQRSIMRSADLTNDDL